MAWRESAIVGRMSLLFRHTRSAWNISSRIAHTKVLLFARPLQQSQRSTHSKVYYKCDSTKLCQRLDAMMDFYINTSRLAGAVCDVRLDGNAIYQKSSGYLNIEDKVPVQTDSIFKVFSLTKPVTAVAILQLDEKGLIDLDDPLHKYLPQFKDLKVTKAGSMDPADWVPLKRDITLRHLLLHTSGFTYSFLGRSDLQRRYEADSIHSLGPGNPPDSLSEVMRRLSCLPIQHQPGAQWSYGVNYDVLGAVIEAVSGESLGSYLHRTLFEPLGMLDTSFSNGVRGKLHRVATSYSPSPGGRGGIEPVGRQAYTTDAIHYGGGGLYSTAGDYQRFCSMLLAGGRYEGNEILSQDSLRLMMTPQLASSVPVRGGMILSFRQYKGYAPSAGGAVLVDPGTCAARGHDGEFMWEGSESAHFWVDPRTGLSAVWLCQLRPLNTYPILLHLKRAVYAPQDSPPPDDSWWTAPPQA